MKFGFMAVTIVVWGMGFVSGVRAEEADVKLPEVVVTATKTEKDPKDVTQSVTVITAEDIKKSGARNVAEVIGGTVGTSVTDQGTPGSLQTLSVRGSEYAQVLVLLDGVRLNSPRDGGFDLSQLPLPLDDIDRIEILRGPASALYGADAVGGVVNVITRKPAAAQSSIEGTAGSHGYDLLSAGQSGSVGGLQYRLSASRETSDGFRTNSDMDRTTVGGRIGYDVSRESSLDLAASYIGKEVGAPGSTDYLTSFARQWTHSTVSGLGFRSRLSKDLDVKIKTFYNNDILTYRWDLLTPASRHESLSYGADGQFDWTLNSSNTFTGGAEARADSLDSTDSGEHATRLWAGYAQDEITLGEQLIVLLGVRYDDHSVYGDTVSPKASARYLVAGSGTIIRASAGRSFRAPTFNDLYWNDAYGNKGNPNLQPERAQEYEAGVEQPFGKGITIRVSGFERKVKNLIEWAPTFPSSPRNIGRAKIFGAEAGVHLKVLTALAWDAGYTFLDPIDEATGEHIDGLPQSEFRSSLSLDLAAKTVLYLEGRAVYNYEKPGEDTWRYSVYNVKVSREVDIAKGFIAQVFLSIKNIFDRDYSTSRSYSFSTGDHTGDYPMPPQEIFGGMSVQF
jgi:outer membrane cobalamin receptor